MKMTTKWLVGGVIGLLVLSVGVAFVYFEYAKRAGKESTIRSQIVSQKGNMSPASENATKLPIEKVIEGEVNSSIISTQSKSETSTAQLPKPKDVSDEQIRLAASIFKMDLQSGFKTDHVSTVPPYGAKVREVETVDGKCLSFDALTGQLMSYFIAKPEEVPVGLTKDNAIPKEKAMSTARSLLKELGVDVDFEDKKTQYQDSIEETSGDLKGGEWVLRGILKYKDIPYFGSGVRVSVSAFSGNVLMYSYRPMGPPPESMESKINVDQASEAVTSFLAKKSTGGPAMEMKGLPQLVIAYPNNFWTRTSPGPLTPAEKPRLCWLVNTQPGGGGSPLLVYVDAQTGQVVGGMG